METLRKGIEQRFIIRRRWWVAGKRWGLGGGGGGSLGKRKTSKPTKRFLLAYFLYPIPHPYPIYGGTSKCQSVGSFL